ncbi:MAG: hypothetical protein R3F65_12665 [bacterium]
MAYASQHRFPPYPCCQSKGNEESPRREVEDAGAWDGSAGTHASFARAPECHADPRGWQEGIGARPEVTDVARLPPFHYGARRFHETKGREVIQAPRALGRPARATSFEREGAGPGPRAEALLGFGRTHPGPPIEAVGSTRRGGGRAMRRSSLRGWSIAVLVALVAGCGGSEPSVDATPSAGATVTHERLRAALSGGAPPPAGALRLVADELDLRSVRLDARAWALLERVDARRVRAVRLGPPSIDAADVDRLCRMPGLEAVIELSIDSGIDMGDEAARFGDAGAERVAACPALRGLASLRLSNGVIGDRGVGALVAADWPRLTTLDLAVNDIGPVGVVTLVASPLAGRLERLRLERNPIGDAGAQALIDSGLLARAEVSFGDRALSEAVADALLRLDALRGLSLDGALFSDEAFARLRAKFGDRVTVP